MVAQYGISADSEEPVGRGEQAARFMTLAFDAKWPEGAVPTTGRAASYVWQLTHAQEGEGRIVQQLHAKPHEVTAARRSYNVQGVGARVESDDAVTLARDIKSITKSEWMQEHVAGLRRRQELARVALSRFAVEGLSLSERKYKEELKRHEHNVARVVFLDGFLEPLLDLGIRQAMGVTHGKVFVYQAAHGSTEAAMTYNHNIVVRQRL